MSPRILVVDDSPTLLKVVSTILARAGFSVDVARDGAQGLALLGAQTYDLVLLDFVMPKMNGYQFSREVRNRPEWKSLPIVLMSAKSDRIRDQFAEQSGAVDAISKPFDARSLVALVEGVLMKVKDGRGPMLKTLHPDEPALWTDAPETRDDVAPFEERAESVLRRYANAAKGERRPVLPLAKALSEIWIQSSSEALSGDLRFVPIPEVLQMLQLQRQTGVIHVDSKVGPRSVSVFFREGLVDLARSPNPIEPLGKLFVEMGAASRSEVEAAAKAAAERSVLLGDELVESARVTKEARQQALERQTSELVYELVRWTEGRFRFCREPLSREAEKARLGLALGSLLMEGFRRVDEWRLMEGTIDWEAVLTIDDVILRDVVPEPRHSERLVLDAVDGKRKVAEVLAATELNRFDALRILYQFLSSKILRALPRGSAEVRPSSSAT